MSNVPINPLDYARPDLNPRRTRWWAWGCACIGVVVLAIFMVRLIEPQNRPRVTTYQQKCLCENFNRIRIAILLYNNGNAGQCPDTLGKLLLTQDIDSTAFVCGQSNTLPSSDLLTKPEQAAEVDSGKCCSYVYLGRGVTFGQAPAKSYNRKSWMTGF